MTPADKLAEQKQKQTKRLGIPPGRKKVWDCRLREKRKEYNFTLRELSEGSGVSVAVLCAIEHGTDPMLSNAKAIADFFGATVESLWLKRV